MPNLTKSPYYFRFIKINATGEDYVSANQKKNHQQQIKQEYFKKYISYCRGLYKLLLL